MLEGWVVCSYVSAFAEFYLAGVCLLAGRQCIIADLVPILPSNSIHKLSDKRPLIPSKPPLLNPHKLIHIALLPQQPSLEHSPTPNPPTIPHKMPQPMHINHNILHPELPITAPILRYV